MAQILAAQGWLGDFSTKGAFKEQVIAGKIVLKSPCFAKQEVMGLEGSVPGTSMCVFRMKALGTVVEERPQEWQNSRRQQRACSKRQAAVSASATESYLNKSDKLPGLFKTEMVIAPNLDSFKELAGSSILSVSLKLESSGQRE